MGAYKLKKLSKNVVIYGSDRFIRLIDSIDTEVRGKLRFSNLCVPDKTEVFIYEGLRNSTRAFGVTHPLNGLKTCDDILKLNEREHISKIAEESGITKQKGYVICIANKQLGCGQNLLRTIFHEVRHVQQLSFCPEVYNITQKLREKYSGDSSVGNPLEKDAKRFEEYIIALLGDNPDAIVLPLEEVIEKVRFDVCRIEKS